MAFDNIAAVQARIQEIDQIIASRAQGTSQASSAATDASNSSDFAALLASQIDNSSTDTSDALSTSSGSGNNNIVSELSQLSQLTNGGATGAVGTLGGSKLAQQFLSTALSQAGKPYVWGASASPTDPNPKAFDCSELTKWAAARVGVELPDVASAQYLYLKQHNALIPVSQALNTPGALLFHFDHEPKNLADDPSAGHVAISVGDGVHTIEARGHAYGTNVFANAAGRGFNFAGVIPGMG
jgi:cell wall-associated NlpC family hydrolase